MCSCRRPSANTSTAHVVAFSPSFGEVFAPWDYHRGWAIVLSSAQAKSEGTMSLSTRWAVFSKAGHLSTGKSQNQRWKSLESLSFHKVMVNRARFYFYYLWTRQGNARSISSLAQGTGTWYPTLPVPYQPWALLCVGACQLSWGSLLWHTRAVPAIQLEPAEQPTSTGPDSSASLLRVPDSASLLQDPIDLSIKHPSLRGSVPSSTSSLPGMEAGGSEPVFCSGNLGNLPQCFPE